MLNELSSYLMMTDENMKFHVGDVICRKGDELMKSQHYKVEYVFMEKHPFYEQVWYMLTNYKGNHVTSLPQNVEGFVKIN